MIAFGASAARWFARSAVAYRTVTMSSWRGPQSAATCQCKAPVLPAASRERTDAPRQVHRTRKARPLIGVRFASSPLQARPCPKFRGSRSWLLNSRRRSGVSWFLPRIRRSPCETDSAATMHGSQGRRGMDGRGPRLRSATQRAREAGRLCRERPLRSGVRRYGSHQRRPTNDGAKLSQRRRVRAVRNRVRPITSAHLGAPAGDEFPMEIIDAWRATST